MKIMIAMDSLKGSLTSQEANEVVAKGVLDAVPDAEVYQFPIADGGEGTLSVFMENWQGEEIFLDATGPDGQRVHTKFGWFESCRTAVLESAAVVGLTLSLSRNPWKESTFGLGEVIKAALEKGAEKIYVGLGGSATNDGGIGMLQALGFRFRDKDRNELEGSLKNYEGKRICTASELQAVRSMDVDGVDKRLENCEILAVCDVTAPLCGEGGATYVFGAQKGLAEERQRQRLDGFMMKYAQAVSQRYQKDKKEKLWEEEGSGAAGGLGFALLGPLKAGFCSGIDLLLKVNKIEEKLADADFVVTGEGKIDGQSKMGKVVSGITRMAERYQCGVIALAGAVDWDGVNNLEGIDAFFCIQNGCLSLQEAMCADTARRNLRRTAEQIFRLAARK